MEKPGRLQSMGSPESDTTERLHFHFHALEKEMATHSSVLAWRIPGTGEPGRLPDWASLELSPSVESCGCGLGPSPVRLG